jgi:hypothetical protein
LADWSVAATWDPEARYKPIGNATKNDAALIIASTKILNKEEIIYLSRIVILDKGNPVLEAVNHAFSVEHGQVECKDCNFFGLPIKHAYIITSKRENGIPQAKSA